MFILLLILLLLVISYLCVGRLANFLSVRYYHDYPGPKIIINGTAGENLDWLLIHGASADARIWQNVLMAFKGKSNMAAVSLGNHEQPLRFVLPNNQSAQDLSDFMKNHNIQRGVIGHSTAALWMASSYNQHPELWKNIQNIILVAPNFGNNINAAVNKQKSVLDYLRWVIPEPYLVLKPIHGCIGSEPHYCNRCTATYMSGRKIRLGSLSYYKKVVSYMSDQYNQQLMLEFLRVFAKRITVVIATNDNIIDNQITLDIIKQFNLNVVEIPTSHIDVINYCPQWLPQ